MTDPRPDGTPCEDDGDACNGVSHCDAGACVTDVAPVSCTGLDGECVVGVCDPADGTCGTAPTRDGVPCEDDGDACNGVSHCDAGVCVADVAPVDCSSAGHACARGTCEPTTGTCVVEAMNEGALCEDDGDACNGVFRCDAGACVEHTAPVDCSDLDSDCRVGRCNPLTGACRADARADGLPCDNGTFCDGDDECVEGECVAAGVAPCDDGNSCTLDTCEEVQQTCTNTPRTPWTALPVSASEPTWFDYDWTTGRVHAAARSGVQRLDPLALRWEYVGSENLAMAGRYVGHPTVAGEGDGICYAFRDEDRVTWCGGGYGGPWDQNLRVRHWNGTSWELVGGILDLSAGDQILDHAMVVDGNVSWVVWMETDVRLVRCVTDYPSNYPVFSCSGQTIAVKRWTGSTWERLGGDLRAQDEYAQLPRIAVVGGQVVVAWPESWGRTSGACSTHLSSPALYVRRWTGTAWELLGGRLASAASSIALAEGPDGRIWVAYTVDASLPTATVVAWNGSAWETVAPPYAIKRATSAVGIAPSGLVAVLFRNDVSDHARAALWSAGAWRPLPDPPCPGDPGFIYSGAVLFRGDELTAYWRGYSGRAYNAFTPDNW